MAYFEDLKLTKSVQKAIAEIGFIEPTPIQEQAIPAIKSGKDVLGIAQTGTGKTAAYILPILTYLVKAEGEDPRVVVLVPTRELSIQVGEDIEELAQFTNIRSVAVYGGIGWTKHAEMIVPGIDILVATPGRLLDLYQHNVLSLKKVKILVIDEADRMLDMGFFDDIMKIEKLLPKDRQTIMFSATMPPKIQQLAKTILHDPEEITIAVARPPETILQTAYICYESQKIEIVKQLFSDKKPNKVILFSGKKQKVKEIAKTLRKMGLSADAMHSDLEQTERNSVMHEFRNERVDILVATDIVSRGIDIDDISLIINFDVPYDAEDYVHRIGRTARAGDSGMAITFVSPDEQLRFSRIEKFLQKNIYKIPVPPESGDVPEYNPEKRRKEGRKHSDKPQRGIGKKRTQESTEKKAQKKTSKKTQSRPDKNNQTGS